MDSNDDNFWDHCARGQRGANASCFRLLVADLFMNSKTPSSSDVTVETRAWRERLIGYGLPALTFIAAAVAAFMISQEKEHTTAAFAVAVVVAFGTLLSAIAQFFRERESSQKSDKLAKLAEENSRLSKALKSEITGGDSFIMAYFPVKDGRRWIALRHYGRETLRDIRIAIFDFDPHRTLDAFVYPSLLPGAIELVKPFEFRGDSFGIQVTFTAPNGWWAQAVKATRVDGQLVFAIQAWRFDSDSRVVLREDVHPKFPRPVDWGMGKPIDVSTLTPATESPEDHVLRSLDMR